MGTKGARKWGRRDAEHREGKGSQPIYRGKRRVRNRAVLPDAPILPLTTEQQRSVRCPRCLAKPGDPCRSQTGRIVAGGHADRRWTARRVHRRRLIGSTPLQVRDIDYQKARKTGGAVIEFWYATIEDLAAALIEAAQACFAINILDEAVFEHALGEPNRQIRAKDRLGRVVTGLELIRNCETHAQIGSNGLLVGRRVVAPPQSQPMPSPSRSRS